MFFRRHGVAVAHREGYAVAQPDMTMGWVVVLGLVALIAAAVYALRSASPQTRALLGVGGCALVVLAMFFGLAFVSHDRVVSPVAEVAPLPMIPLDMSGTPRVEPPRPQPPSARKSSSKSKRSKSPPVVSTSADAPVQPSAKPAPPEPSDDHGVAATSPAVAAPAATATQPAATPTPEATNSVPGAVEHAAAHGDHEHDSDDHSHDAQPNNRPAWIDSKGEYAADGTYFAVVHTPPKLTLRDAMREVEPRMRDEAQEFVNTAVPRARYQRWFNGLHWSSIIRRAEKERFVETLHSRYADADTVVVHVRMAFTPQLQQEIMRMIQDVVLWQRTGLLVLIGAFVLAAIGILYGYLRLDTATKGYYTWRLRLLAVALVCFGFSGMCFIVEEFDLDNAFETMDFQPIAQAQSGRLR
jgi:hypothetical protein